MTKNALLERGPKNSGMGRPPPSPPLIRAMPEKKLFFSLRPSLNYSVLQLCKTASQIRSGRIVNLNYTVLLWKIFMCGSSMMMFNVPQFLLLQDPKEMAGKKKDWCSWIRENDGKLHCPIFHRRRIDSADILCDFSLTGSAKLWHIFYWVVQKAWIAVFQMDLEVSFYKHRKNCECCPGHSLTVSQPSKSLSL